MLDRDPVDTLCMLLGITPNDLSCPSRILKLDPQEKNQARIEMAARECFARVQSLRNHVRPEHAEWMMQVVSHARSCILREAMAPAVVRSVQRAPAAVPMAAPRASVAASREPEQSPAVRTCGQDEPRDSMVADPRSTMGALVACGLALLVTAWFIDQPFEAEHLEPRRHAANAPALLESRPVPPAVGIGGGTPVTTKPRPPVPGCVERVAPQADRRNPAHARMELSDALALSRRGSFDEALRLTRRASRLLPEQGGGLSLLVAYARQYSGLADKARTSLNGSSEIDLGAPYGTAQFVEQNANEITFFANGKHQTFSIREFNGLAGVRFRATRDFLDNAANPANDLILAACHFLMKVDDRGEHAANADFVREAERRIEKAITSGNPEFAEQGKMMMQAIKALAEE